MNSRGIILLPFMLLLATNHVGALQLPVDQLRIAGQSEQPAVKDEWCQLRAGKDHYWTLPDDGGGQYFVTLLAQSGDKLGEELLHGGVLLYRNGIPVWFATATTPRKINGVWTAEFQTDHPITVTAGDEFRLSKRLGGKWVGVLNLVPAKPQPGPLPVHRYWGPSHEDRVRGSVTFPSSSSVRIALTNMQGRQIKYRVETRVVDHFQKPIARDQRELTIANHGSASFELPFPNLPTDRYRCVVEVSDPQDQQTILDREILVDQNDGARGKMWLNDGWQVARVTGVECGETPPADAKWEPVDLPTGLGMNNTFHVSWWKRTLTPPKWMKGERNVLRFDRTDFEATVYCNGKQIAKHLGRAPFEVDLTGLLKWGERNELWVALRNGVSVLTPAELKRTLTITSTSEVESPGAGPRMAMWEVCLLKEPSARISDVFVQPSFQKKRLDVDVETAGLAKGTYTVEAVVEFEGKTVLSLPANTLDNLQHAVLGADWEKPILWGLESPNLLCLSVRLKDADGKMMDKRRVRFGFRELAAQGTSLMLNGVPVKFRAFAMSDDWGMSERMKRDSTRDRIHQNLALGGQFACHINSPIYAEIADELGLPVEFYTTSIAHPTIQKIESERYWENARQDAAAVARDFRNHPSILLWYISNEFAECSPPQLTDLAINRLRSLADTVRGVDPTRILQSGCDLDLRGHLDIVSTHYPVDMHAQNKHTAFMPSARLWRAPNAEFQKGMRVPAGQVKTVANVRGESPITWGDKPILVHETGWVAMFRPLGGLVEFGGESIYHSPNALTDAFHEAERVFAEGHRDAGASLIDLWIHIFNWSLPAALPSCAIMPITENTGWFASSRVNYDVNIHHDVTMERTCRLEWGVRLDGAFQKQGEKNLKLGPAALARDKVNFTLPSTETPREIALTMRLIGPNNEPLATREMIGRVHPKRPFDKPTVKLALIDPSGQTKAALQRAGLDLPVVPPNAIGEVNALIIGENAAEDPALKQYGDTIREFVERGGNLLILRQDSMPQDWLGLGLPALADMERSHGLIRASHSPSVADLTNNDLKWWLPDGRIGSKPYRKPSTGNFETIIDTSFAADGLEFSLTLELRKGRGRVLATQLLLADRLETAPAARGMTQRLLTDITRPATPFARTAVLARPGREFDRALARLGVDAERIKPGDSTERYQVVLLDGDLTLEEKDAARLKSFVQGGGMVVVHRAGRDQAAMRTWFGTGATPNAELPPMWTWRAMRVTEDPWLDGLSDADLFWRKAWEGEDAHAYFSEARFALDSLTDLIWEIPNARALTYPPVLTRVNDGKGAWLVDNIRWDVSKAPTANRIGMALLNNLGVPMKGRQPARTLTNLEYDPLDLQTALNRPLTDEKADDQSGGWTDQGPGSDLRAFTPGRHVFHGVPFVVPEGKSCLVMSSKHRKIANPMQAKIPVGSKASALYFLQTSAWTSSEPHATIIVRYDDGTSEEIPLEGGVNLRDWVAKEPNLPFTQEANTVTQAAWSGTAKDWPVVSLFMMQWINPHPEKSIQSLVVQSANNGIYLLLGVTLGLEKSGPQKVKEVATDPARAKILYDEGVSLVGAGKNAPAVEKFRQALASDPSNLSIRLRLAQALTSAGEKAESERVLKETIEKHPETIEAYLQLGRLLEDAGRLEEARAVYRKGLDIDLNQPPLVQAIERIDRELSKEKR